MSRPTLPPSIAASRVVIVARGLERAKIDALLLLGEPGSLVIEVTLDSPDATEHISRLSSAGVTVGAGTVLSQRDAESAIDAGAQFLVSPLLDEPLVSWAANAGAAIAAGAMTPTEVSRAWAAGAAAVKIFPASVVGPQMIRELRGPIGHIPLMPTGGIDSFSAPRFLQAGAVAVGIGGWLTAQSGSDLIERWEQIMRAIWTGP